MRRWHAERSRMLRRWRLEIAKHEWHDQRQGFRTYSSYDFAPIPPVACEDSCHCYRGPGFFRKRHPLDCGNSRCGLCHYDKWDVPGAANYDRANRRRQAIDFDIDASI